MDELVYTVDGAAAVRAQPITLAEAGLREREHLQEWVLEHPEMLGGPLLVITSECDRWVSAMGRERDRLDVLALDPDGHLVVVELKRDEAPETVEMQALKYAAYCSQFTPDTLVEEYRGWRERSKGGIVDADTAAADLEAHLAEDVGGLAGAPLNAPRIVLLAGGFTPGAATALVVTADEHSLAELAGTGGGPSNFDAGALHRLMDAPPRGRWTTYGDIAPLVGTVAQPLGRHITTCARCEHAWRVLQDSGRPAAGFPPARPAGTGWPAAATANSTPPCTASPSPRSACTAPAAPTTNADAATETAPWKPSAPSNDASPASYSHSSHPRPQPELAPRPRLDIEGSRDSSVRVRPRL